MGDVFSGLCLCVHFFGGKAVDNVIGLQSDLFQGHNSHQSNGGHGTCQYVEHSRISVVVS